MILSGHAFGSLATSPAEGQELVSSGPLTSPEATTAGYWDVTFTLRSTLVGPFVVGVYDASNVAVRTFSVLVLANSAQQVTFPMLKVENGYKLRVVNPAALLTAVVQASVNYVLKDVG